MGFSSGSGLRRTRTSGLADARSGPSRGEAAARCGFAEAANSAFKIQDSKLRVRAAACGGCGPLHPFGRKFKIRWVAGDAWAYVTIRGAACGGHARSGPAGRELRASAAPRLRPERSYRTETALRPANRCAIDPRQRARSRADGLATIRSSPPPGGGCGLHGLFKAEIQNEAFEFGTQPAEAAHNC